LTEAPPSTQSARRWRRRCGRATPAPLTPTAAA